MRPIAIFVLVFSLLGNLSCSVNILENFADKNSNEALLQAAELLINAGDYTGALAKLALMTGSAAASREAISMKAKAYGGLCGLNTIQFVLALQSLGTSKLLPFLVNHFRSGASTTRAANCRLAEDLIESIGSTAAARTLDENLLLTLISFAKIGNILSFYTDTAPQDGVAQNAADVCTTGNMPDVDAGEFGTGFTLASASLTAIGAQVQVLADIATAVSGICGGAPFSTLCAKTDPTGFSGPELLAIRSLAQEGSALGLNLGTCGGGTVASSVNCRCFP